MRVPVRSRVRYLLAIAVVPLLTLTVAGAAPVEESQLLKQAGSRIPIDEWRPG